jgi:hypothetical protein
MVRKLHNPGFVTMAQFAQKLGVTHQAVSQAVRSGRLVAYDNRGDRVQLDYAGRKWLKQGSATDDWNTRRQRFDDDSTASGDLLAARTRAVDLQRELLEIKLARIQGELIPRTAALASSEALGRAVGSALDGVAGWNEEFARGGPKWLPSGLFCAIACFVG